MGACSVVVVLTLLFASAAHAVVIFDSFGPGYEFNGGQGSPVTGSATIDGYDRWDVACGFIAGASGGLDSIILAMAIGDDRVPVNQLALSLCSDASGQPGGVIESWTIPVPVDYGFGIPHPPFQASSVLKPTLAAGTQYWLMSEAATDQSILVWNDNSIGDWGPVSTRTNGGAWSIYSGLRGAFQVNGTAQAVPEPATVALFGLGVVALVLRRRKTAAL